MDHALIEFLSSSEVNRAPQKLTLVSRILPHNANTAPPLMLTLQLFDPNSAQWVAVASESLLATTYGRGNFFSLDLTIPNSSTYAVMGGRPLRWRLSLGGDQWREWDIDAVEMQTTPTP
jgi:hypothetical protein